MKDKKNVTKDNRSAQERVEEMERFDRINRISRPQGYYSNQVIRIRNGGVRHQFEDSIGGCSSNYR